MKAKILKVLTLLSAAFTLGFAFGDTIFIWILKQWLQADISQNEAASIGVIGGADGPTSVFLAGTPSNGSKAIGTIVSFLIFIICLLQVKKLKKVK